MLIWNPSNILRLASFAMKWLHPILAGLPQLPLKLMCYFIDGFATTFGKPIFELTHLRNCAGLTPITLTSNYHGEFTGTLSLGLIPTLKDPTRQSSAGEPLILPMLLIPLLCGSGASLLVPFFGLFQPQFSFGHPGFLSENLSVDFWGPWMISLCYGTIVDGRGLLFGGCRRLLQSGTLYDFNSESKIGSSPAPWMRPEEAHVLCSLVLSFTYIINEFGPQILNKLTITGPGNSTTQKEKAQRG